ncbi:hypothetical protein KI387_001349, partial [Taxus chinensis]
ESCVHQPNKVDRNTTLTTQENDMHPCILYCGWQTSHAVTSRAVKDVLLVDICSRFLMDVFPDLLKLKAFGAEGMIKEVVQYFHVAEDLFNCRDAPLLGTSIYNVVVHALVQAKEEFLVCKADKRVVHLVFVLWEMAIDIFERMKSFGIRPNAETYTIMIDCCTLNRDLVSARGLMATMLQHGYKHHARTYTSILKILLANDEFDKVLNFLKEMKEEGIRSDVIVYNTILRQASEKVRFDVIELLVEHMHRQKIKPDPETCLQVFSSYYEHGFLDTALEALQVLSVRMVSESESVQRKMKSTYEELILDEGADVEESL